MKLQTPSEIRRGFTLVELLVVISIIAVLAGLAAPAAMKAMAKAKAVQAKKVCTDIDTSIGVFFTDYSRYPVENLAETPIKTDVGGEEGIISTLVGNNEALNPKNETYLTVREGKNKKNGLVWEGNEPQLFDPWGEPYYIKLDHDYDKKIDTPQIMDSDEEFIRGRNSITWSLGADQASESRSERRDNVYSWKK